MKSLLLAVFAMPLLAGAQNFHFSTRLGLAGYQGDLKLASQPLSQLKLMGSLGAQYDLTERLAARAYFTYATLQADDKKGHFHYQPRNLNFKSNLLEFELGAQYSLFTLNEKWWTPYGFAGLGVFRFNPYTSTATQEKVYLQPLATEGQGVVAGVMPYSRTQLCLPIGLGMTYSLGEDTRIGVEGGYRKLFTDYLDDVSGSYADEAVLRAAKGQQSVDLAWRGDELNGAPYPVAKMPRGGPGKDSYYYVALTFTVRYWFNKYKQINGIPGGGRGDKKVGCPSTHTVF